MSVLDQSAAEICFLTFTAYQHLSGRAQGMNEGRENLFHIKIIHLNSSDRAENQLGCVGKTRTSTLPGKKSPCWVSSRGLGAWQERVECKTEIRGGILQAKYSIQHLEQCQCVVSQPVHPSLPEKDGLCIKQAASAEPGQIGSDRVFLGFQGS